MFAFFDVKYFFSEEEDDSDSLDSDISDVDDLFSKFADFQNNADTGNAVKFQILKSTFFPNIIVF